MSIYNELNSFDKQIIDQTTFDNNLKNGSIIKLHGNSRCVFVGKGLRTKMNVSVGLNSKAGFTDEVKKIKSIGGYIIRTDTMMDLSTAKVENPLYEVIKDEIGCPVGTIPYYTCFHPSYGIDRSELLDTIEQQAESGVSFMTLHLTADLGLAEQALSRKIPIISRGGSLLLRDMKLNGRSKNILLSCWDQILKILVKHKVVVNIGTTYRPSSLHDALDLVHVQELKAQKALCETLIANGLHVQMEGIGHISLSRLPEYIALLRTGRYIPFMPLGPIVSDHTAGHDHITAAVGASSMAAFGGADIVNAVTREEHTGGIPDVRSILEAIDATNVAIQIAYESRFPENNNMNTQKYYNCMGTSTKVGCSRCGAECPFFWNNEQ